MSPPEPYTILAFGAHPDDIEFGCGAVIAKETSQGSIAHVVICSRGEAASHGSPDERTLEATTAAACLNASIEFLELGGDCHLQATPAHAIRLAEVIRRRRPQVVLAPTLTENQHPDHSTVGRLARDASRLARFGGLRELKHLPPHAVDQLLYFAVTAEGEMSGQLGVMIDVSAAPVVSAWTAAMQAHATQGRTRNYVELQLARARLNGLRCGADYAVVLYPNDPPVVDSLRSFAGAARRF